MRGLLARRWARSRRGTSKAGRRSRPPTASWVAAPSSRLRRICFGHHRRERVDVGHPQLGGGHVCAQLRRTQPVAMRCRSRRSSLLGELHRPGSMSSRRSPVSVTQLGNPASRGRRDRLRSATRSQPTYRTLREIEAAGAGAEGWVGLPRHVRGPYELDTQASATVRKVRSILGGLVRAASAHVFRRKSRPQDCVKLVRGGDVGPGAAHAEKTVPARDWP